MTMCCEVFATDTAFGVPYKPKLDLIMGGEPFFLGMGDTPQYRADTAAMRKVMRPDDLPGLAPRSRRGRKRSSRARAAGSRWSTRWCGA
jgi:hypothetical protein